MLRELLSIFRSEKPLAAMGRNFAEMLQITYQMTLKAGDIFFGQSVAPDDRTQIYKQDIEVNRLERTIRRQVIAHLSIDDPASLPYCLLLMSLVKDAERLGDYAKNLSEAGELHPDPLPDDEIVGELREIRAGVEAAFGVTAEVFAMSDRERALALIREGRDLTHRCDALVAWVARSEYNAAMATSVALGARFYKRVGAHVLNILSSVVMPLHKLDYYDEDEIERQRQQKD